MTWLLSRGAFSAWLVVATSLLCCALHVFNAELVDDPTAASGVMEVLSGDLKAALSLDSGVPALSLRRGGLNIGPLGVFAICGTDSLVA
jgi:hypothetical protein